MSSALLLLDFGEVVGPAEHDFLYESCDLGTKSGCNADAASLDSNSSTSCDQHKNGRLCPNHEWLWLPRFLRILLTPFEVLHSHRQLRLGSRILKASSSEACASVPIRWYRSILCFEGGSTPIWDP